VKNIITILIDSVYADCLGQKDGKLSFTPFIDSLVNQNSLFSTNMYSYAPFTNAATKSLFTFSPTLNNYGYYFGINSSEENYLTTLKSNNYKIYNIHYPYYLLNDTNLSLIDHHIYTSGFLFRPIWRDNFEYYANLKLTRQLEKIEYSLMIKALEIVFSSWINYYNNLITDSNSSSLIKLNIGYFSIKDGLDIVNKENDSFKLNKLIYLENLLTKRENHILFNIDKIDTGKFVNKKVINKSFNNNKKFINRISRMTFYLNFINLKLNFKLLFSSLFNFLKTFKLSKLRYFYNIYAALFNVSIMKKQIKDKVWQEVPSARKLIDKTIETINTFDFNNKNFLFVHLLDPHERVSFFTYDSEDYNLIDEELTLCNFQIDNLDKSFKGSLIYQLSLFYVDNQIKRLFDFLKNKNLEDKFTIILLSDHGSSYTYKTIRNNVVNNFFRENYKVPLLIWDKKINFSYKTDQNIILRSDNVFPTVFDLNEFIISNDVKLKSILNKTPKKDLDIITEYMGPGCADMTSKSIWMSIRNNSFMLSIENKINEMFKPTINEFYDLRNDKFEENNLINLRNSIKYSTEINYLISKLGKRFYEIQCSTNDYLSKIKL